MQVQIVESKPQTRFSDLAVFSCFTENSKAKTYMKISEDKAVCLETHTEVSYLAVERVHPVKSMSVEV